MIIKHFHIIFGLFFGIGLLSCQKAPVLTITSPISVELSVDGSSETITFTANRDWAVGTSDSWVTVSPSSGAASDGPVTVTVRCDANTTYDDRTSTVTIKMEDLTQSISVRQPANIGLIVPIQSYEVEVEGGAIEVEVQANVNYEVNISAHWIKQSSTKALTTDKLAFIVEENKTRDVREATITISGSGKTQVVTIKQKKEYYLTFDIVSGGAIIWKCPEGVEREIQYSKNGGEWISITSSKEGEEIPVSAGDAIRFRGYNSAYSTDYYPVEGNTSYWLWYNNSFNTSDGTTFNARGNIMSLIYGDESLNTNELAEDKAFRGLFSACNGLLTAPELSATTLTEQCYSGMFDNCISLKTPPDLPATELAKECYMFMFSRCHSLEKVPELPATTLTKGCYQEMFSKCTSLKKAQNKLPATKLADICYSYMFDGCTSLISAPELPATTLALGCYIRMFGDCTSLVNAPELPGTVAYDRCYMAMFQGCTSLTSAPELPATTVAEECYLRMFEGCTSLKSAPELPATVLAKNCYVEMFSGCSSLVSAPVLPATSLASACYSGMFSECTSLVEAPELPALVLENDCYGYMFDGCTSLKVAPELPATSLDRSCYSAMFYGCYNLTKAPELLPATSLAQYCYLGMFEDCTSLVIAPTLPAKELANSCYSYMFSGCTSLNYVECLATLVKSGACNNWLQNTSSSGIFVKNPVMNSWPTGDSGIPVGWTVMDAE